MKSLAMRIGLAVAICFSGAAQAALVWDNGAPSATNLGGSNMSDTKQAQDFILTGSTNLTGVRFWNLELVSTDYIGSIFYQIFTNAAGIPSNTVVASGTATPTRVAAGAANSVLGYSPFQNDFAITASLAAGTYWLSLHNGALSSVAFTDFYWTWTDIGVANNTGTILGQEMGLDPVTGWTTNDQEMAFNIFGDAGAAVPEPATFAVAAAGLLVVGLLRKKQ